MIEAKETRMWPDLSIVVPCLNEEQCIPHFLNELDQHLDKLPSLEVVFVDDGSTDRTCEIAQSFAGVRVISAVVLPKGWTGKASAAWTAAKQSLPASTLPGSAGRQLIPKSVPQEGFSGPDFLLC